MLRKVVSLGYFCTKTQLYTITVTPNIDNIIQRFETVVVYFMKILSGSRKNTTTYSYLPKRCLDRLAKKMIEHKNNCSSNRYHRL